MNLTWLFHFLMVYSQVCLCIIQQSVNLFVEETYTEIDRLSLLLRLSSDFAFVPCSCLTQHAKARSLSLMHIHKHMGAHTLFETSSKLVVMIFFITGDQR